MITLVLAAAALASGQDPLPQPEGTGPVSTPPPAATGVTQEQDTTADLPPPPPPHCAVGAPRTRSAR